MKRLLALGLAAICLACALPLTACTPQQKLYSASWFDMFDTVTTVSYTHLTPKVRWNWASALCRRRASTQPAQ